MKAYCVYMHCRPGGIPFYVGKSSNRKRPYTMHRNEWHNRIVAKHGAENIEVRIVECRSEDHANAVEKWMIRIGRKIGCELTNLTDGGEGTDGFKQSAEHVQARAAVHRGAKRSEEVCRRLSEAHKGQVITDEARRAISAFHAGRKRSEETKRRISESQKGKTFSAETRAKMSAAHERRRQLGLYASVPRSLELRARDSELAKERMRDPEMRRRISESLKKRAAERKSAA